jgi:hypothetical protein
MAISPFATRPGPMSPQSEGRRARLVLAIALIGIGATLLAYAISPTVRHAIGHAAHSVKGAVTKVFHHESKPATGAKKANRHASTTHGRTARSHRKTTASARGANGGSRTPSGSPSTTKSSASVARRGPPTARNAV